MKENSNGTDTNVGRMENSIEEDIEKINTYIELVLKKDYCNCNELNTILGKHCDGSKNVAYAMQHILSDYKRVLEINEVLLKENEHKTEKIENQKAELAILNEKQKDFNKLQNTLSSYRGQFRRQEKENKKTNSLIRKLKKDSKERQWIQTVDDEYLAHTEKAMYADELLSFLRGEE